MQIIKAGFFCTMFVFLFTGCTWSQSRDQEKAQELITVRTLGLAYLEEFKLEEAEQQFLRLIKLAPKEKLGYANLGLTYLRMGKYPEAKKQLQRAIRIDPKDPDTRLILSTVYQMNNEQDLAISEMKEALRYSPSHVKTLYNITEVYATMTDANSAGQREIYLKKLAESAPANVVPRLNLTDVLIRKGDFDSAVEQMEILKKQYPEFPAEAGDYYTRTLKLLRAKDEQNAVTSFTIFNNFLKVSAPYQAGIMDLKGPGGSLVGFPLITFDQSTISQTSDVGKTAEAVHFTNATSSAGLDILKSSGRSAAGDLKYASNVVTCDYDNDGDVDLYVSSCPPGSSQCNHYLLNNNLGRFRDVTSTSGLKHSGREFSAAFADYDNDGYFDLYILREGGNLLYRNSGKGTFENVTARSKVGGQTPGTMALFFDYDHDGDLDIFEAGTGTNRLYRNNADGTFLEQGQKAGVSGGNVRSSDAVFGDFDEDGDIDLFVVNESGGNTLYSNQRQGYMRNITDQSGLKNDAGSRAVDCGDYDNDGYSDLFVLSVKAGNNSLYRNLRNGTFEKDTRQKTLYSKLQNLTAYDAAFIDFNNDGFLDLFVTGETTVKGSKGVVLFLNDGKGIFSDASDRLPGDMIAGNDISVIDYNEDGDLDIVLGGVSGGVSLLRNDGGNVGHFINMKLVGLRTGSAKNNFFGIGAKVELRAGDLYQTKIVTDPSIHFGIGNRSKADVIRITWTNGVPQNMFFPETDQSIIEAQILKGSCPFLYTWNGDEYVFAKDILWRSALGMPLGIMGGETKFGFADASDDYIKIPGELMKPVGGKYSIQVTTELWEAIYTDKIELVAVDHPGSVDIYVEEQFTPPPFPGMKIYKVKDKIYPVSAVDAEGNDLLPFILRKDDNYISNFENEKYQGITEMKDLILDPGDMDAGKQVFLFMQGWVFPTDASINFSLTQTETIKTMAPVIQVKDQKGEWVNVIDNPGFPMGKDKTVIADLTGKYLSSDHRVRIRTNMQIYWDEIFFSNGQPDSPLVTTNLQPVTADLHYRGFSRLYRKGGRYGPHWFDYSEVETSPKWRDLTGFYTRFGDVLPLLTDSDSKYVITNAGDEITMEFDAGILPELEDGWKRDFLIRSVGWVKDGDINTATGNEVLPLPFHGLKSYPPADGDKYPDDEDHQKYLREYNTREVRSESYMKAFRELKIPEAEKENE